jgi:repressor LexA
MIGKGIFSGDIAVLNRQPDVQDGEIAAVLLDDEATLKIFRRQAGEVVLHAANPAEPDRVIGEDDHKTVLILGRFVGLIRRVGGRS